MKKYNAILFDCKSGEVIIAMEMTRQHLMRDDLRFFITQLVDASVERRSWGDHLRCEFREGLLFKEGVRQEGKALVTIDCFTYHGVPLDEVYIYVNGLYLRTIVIDTKEV